MNKYSPYLLALPLLTLASVSHAQEVWTYQTVGPHNVVSTSFRPLVDLTYPADGVPTTFVDIRSKASATATPLTRQQEATREAQPQLIITLMSPNQADHLINHDLR